MTILPRGPALGFTSTMKEADSFNFTQTNLQSLLDVCMGGRVAEELIFGPKEITTGCSDDVQKATDIAYDMVRKFGIDANGTHNFILGEKKELSESSNTIIDSIVQDILKVFFVVV